MINLNTIELVYLTHIVIEKKISFEDYHNLYTKIHSPLMEEKDSDMVIGSLHSKDLITIDPNSVGSFYIPTELGIEVELVSSKIRIQQIEEEKKLQEKQRIKEQKEFDKLHYDLENARDVYENYPTTKKLAKWGVFLAILAIILQLIQIFAKL